jgi:hypothetical protein
MKFIKVLMFLFVSFITSAAQAAIVQIQFAGTTSGVSAWSNSGSSWDGNANAFSGSFSYDNSVAMGSGDGIWTSNFYNAITDFTVSVNDGITNFSHSIQTPFDSVSSSKIYQTFNTNNQVHFSAISDNKSWNLYMELFDFGDYDANHLLDLDQRVLAGGGYFTFTYKDSLQGSGLTFNGQIASAEGLSNQVATVPVPSSLALMMAGFGLFGALSVSRKKSLLIKHSID